MLNAGAGDIDVMQVDIIWPGLLGDHFVDLKPHVDQAVLAAMFPTVVRSHFHDGRLVAMPWFTDEPLLSYRPHLLEKYGLEGPATRERSEERRVATECAMTCSTQVPPPHEKKTQT